MKLCITGGTGSLGQALLAHFLPDPEVTRLVVLSRDEVKQDALSNRFVDLRLNWFLGDVRDRERCQMAFHGCDTVVHAAALKRITRGANDPWEFTKTNVLGTINVILAALAAKVERVLFISSDKAVEATNLYGKTKALAEDFAVQSNSYTYPQALRVSVLRYGNVMASRGSVLEVWQGQAAEGGPLTLTDTRMTRFLVSLPQAARWVHATLDRMEGGEIFVPRLPSARIVDLAGLLHPTVPIKYTGIRSGGEKLHEILISQEEKTRTMTMLDPFRYVILPSHHSWRTAPWAYYPIVGDVPSFSSAGHLLRLGALYDWLHRESLI